MVRGLCTFLLAVGLAASTAAGANIPRQSPELAIKLVDGQQILVSQYRGKVVIVEFLLTYCQHCQKSSQAVNKLAKEYGPKGLVAVGAAINDMATLYIPDYIRQFQLIFPVGVTSRETAVDYLQHPVMLRMMMPQLVIIDRKGVIRAQYSGDNNFFENEEKNLRAVIDPLLNEGATNAAKPAAKRAPTKKKSS